MKTSSETIFNGLLSLTFLNFAIQPLFTEPESQQPIAVRLILSAILCLMAGLAWIRTPTLQQGSWSAIWAALPSLALSGWLGSTHKLWPVWPQVIFVAGGGLTLIGFIHLGKSFSVLPARRQIKCNGPYRWVRHPIYLGELTMVLACCLTTPHTLESPTQKAWLSLFQHPWWLFAGFMLLLAWVVIRIQAEEKLLQTAPAYQEYQTTVRWRLIPFLY